MHLIPLKIYKHVLEILKHVPIKCKILYTFYKWFNI